MKVCVFGAGAIGSHVAVRLHEGGAQTSVIARGAQLAAIKAGGIRMRVGGEETVAAVAASDDPAALGVQDAVIVTLKAPALPSLAATIGPLLGPDTPVVFAMNGIPWWYFYKHGGEQDGRRLPAIDAGDAVWRAVGPERAIGGIVYSACEVTEPGVVEVASAKNRLVFGEPDGRRSERAEAIAAVLSRGGLPTVVTETVRDEIWSKLMGNIASGPLGILSQSPVNAFASDPACEGLMRSILAEAAAIAEALGCRPSRDTEGRIASMRNLAHKNSILQDLERGRPMEIEAIYRTPLELARMAKVPTPVLDWVIALATLRARAAGLLPEAATA
ncbi:MAG TPA: 2-dehydropantoate 2-reductase [Devosiaceae bacterium]|nr:2-dehydropantoate 2-reductase [Devosiaceae bacterium]